MADPGQLSEANLLSLWEAAAARHPIDRALALAALTGAPDTAADMPLGDLNRWLLGVRRARFGARFALWADCTDCGARMELEFDAGDLPIPDAFAETVEVEGAVFRRPTSRDLAAALSMGDAAAVARALLTACALDPGSLPAGDALDALAERAGAAFDTADPWADPELSANCPECDATQHIRIDIGGVLWDEVAATAMQLLDQVHSIAAAYGWPERDILQLSVARRASYLTRIGNERAFS